MNFMKVALQIIFETESLSAKSADLKSNFPLTPRVGAKVRLKQVDVPSFFRELTDIDMKVEFLALVG